MREGWGGCCWGGSVPRGREKRGDIIDGCLSQEVLFEPKCVERSKSQSRRKYRNLFGSWGNKKKNGLPSCLADGGGLSPENRTLILLQYWWNGSRDNKDVECTCDYLEPLLEQPDSGDSCALPFARRVALWFAKSTSSLRLTYSV